jgi:glycosyltransferase involved in cell wall biosynthesis
VKISLITVCLNSESYIANAIESVDLQTWPDIEHIIVDGGSSDSTLDIIGAYRKPWRYLISEPDQGIYDAMNKGLALASGEVVGFINSDDYYPSDQSIQMIGEAFSNRQVDACWGNLCYVEQHPPNKVIRYWESSDFTPGNFAKGWNPPHPTFFVRKKCFLNLGRFDLNYKIASDIELMARFLEVGKVESYFIPKVLVHMRIGGTTNKNFSNIIQQNLEISRGLLALGLDFSWLKFLIGKFLNRSLQYFKHPI